MHPSDQPAAAKHQKMIESEETSHAKMNDSRSVRRSNPEILDSDDPEKLKYMRGASTGSGGAYEINVNRKVMAFLGVSATQSYKIEQALRSLEEEIKAGEAERFELLNQSDSEVIIKIPKVPRLTTQEEKFAAKIAEIAPEQASQVMEYIGSTVDEITAGFGSKDRYVRLRGSDRGVYIMDVIDQLENGELNPEDKLQFNFDRVQKYSPGHTRYEGADIPERYQNIFNPK